MKIKVAQEDLTRAIQRLVGIDLIIDTVEEARKALRLILERTKVSQRDDFRGLKEIKISQRVEHATTAMEHRTVFVIEFLLEDESYLPMEIELIQELQGIFRRPSP
jgi:hypothetical protein